MRCHKAKFNKADFESSINFYVYWDTLRRTVALP